MKLALLLRYCKWLALLPVASILLPISSAAEGLPKCRGFNANWNNCFGIHRRINYEGEFKKGKPHGVGLNYFYNNKDQLNFSVSYFKGGTVGKQVHVIIYHWDGFCNILGVDWTSSNREMIVTYSLLVEMLSTYWPTVLTKVTEQIEKGRCTGIGQPPLTTSIKEPQRANPPAETVAPVTLEPPTSGESPAPDGKFTDGGIVVSVSEKTVGGVAIAAVSIDGDLRPGDDKVFNRALLTLGDKTPIVFLNSLGGDLNAGIQIGNAIWNNELATAVVDRSVCASACALAWLAGRPRFAEPGVSIGFHAPTRVDDPTRSADSAGSAVTGGYLNKLGLKSGAIAYMTEMGPDEMRWLSPEDAAQFGIDFTEWAFGAVPKQ